MMASFPVNEHASPWVGDILSFWFAPTKRKTFKELNRLWFGADPQVDQAIGAQFGSLVERALAGGLRDWEGDPESRLALILLLDQFTRQIFRGTARAFSGDPRARRLSRFGMADGLFKTMPWPYQLFALMPLEHSESLSDQQQMVDALTAMAAAVEVDQRGHVQNVLRYAKQHRDIIQRFGRFPHRNRILGRSSTAAEDAFLVDGPRFGQGAS